MQNIDWFDEGLQLSYVGTNNVNAHDLTPRLKYIMIIIDN